MQLALIAPNKIYYMPARNLMLKVACSCVCDSIIYSRKDKE